MSETPSALRLRSLHPEFGIPDVDIRPYVEDVRKHGLSTLNGLGLDPKTRRNVLTALLIERMWGYNERSEEHRQDTFGLEPSDCDSLKSVVSEGTFREIVRKFQSVTEAHLLVASECCSVESDAIVEELKNTEFLDARNEMQVAFPDRFNLGIENANMMGWESIHQLPYLHRKQCPSELMLSSDEYQKLAARNITRLSPRRLEFSEDV